MGHDAAMLEHDLWPLRVYGTPEVLRLWERSLLEEIYREVAGDEQVDFIDAQMFMASDAPVLFFAGADPWDATYVRMFHTVLSLSETMPPPLRLCWQRWRTEEFCSEDWREILHLMTAPSA